MEKRSVKSFYAAAPERDGAGFKAALVDVLESVLRAAVRAVPFEMEERGEQGAVRVCL